ncbi:ribonuclease H2 subunit B isoform X1 [Phyllopteryx taeniolatus]|uniref:ribonuclease H2 subunit B isoform X1 n=2 Tax=Phyllopteryx taeniolatus TaxID=161469 RepID=UPI002AD4C3C5|nr:ribonuclease H2 subunit B isoform X1 [Phyllopteryx taeniolatus]
MASKKRRTPNVQNDSWVVIAAGSVLDSQRKDSEPTFVRLRNPATDAASLYMLSGGGGDLQLYEVKAFEEDFRSWFVGQTVQRDGRLLFVTPMDPLYLILPYSIKSGKDGKFQPVAQMVMDEEFPACTRLLSCVRSLASMHHITDEKEVGSLQFHRYSREKTMAWLKKKVEKTVLVLKKKNISVGEGVKSSTYVRVKMESDSSEEDYLSYAHGLISEYISQDLSKDLRHHLQLPEVTSPKETEPPFKKRKLSDKPVEPGEDYTQFNSGDFARKPPKKLTAAQKNLAKADKSGMKTMSSFFSPQVKGEKK